MKGRLSAWLLVAATTWVAIEPAGAAVQARELRLRDISFRHILARFPHEPKPPNDNPKPTSGDESSVNGTGAISTTTAATSNATTTESCEGTSTYYGGVPKTVYATVTVGYEVTVPASASFTAEETLYTPPPACNYTVLPWESSSQSDARWTTGPPYGNLSAPAPYTSGSPGQPTPRPDASSFRPPPLPPWSSDGESRSGFVSATVPAQAPLVTVTVTKKTPVRVTPTVTNPGVHFPSDPPDNRPTLNAPPPTTTPPTVQPNTNPTPTNKPGDNSPPPPGQNNPSNNPTNNPNQTPNSPSQGSGGSTGTGGGSSGGGGNGNNNNNPSNSGGGGGLGSIINSIINSPFAAPSTFFGPAVPTATLLHGVPLQVGPSTANFGGQTVPLPSASQQTTVVVNGETFTVRPSEVVVGSDTLTISRQHGVTQAPQSLAVVPLATSTVTANGITITIGPSQAVVSGTTYRIGPNAPAKTVFFAGGSGGGQETLIFDSDGVVLPSTTYNPALTVINPFITTTIGAHLVITLDMSEAIVSGTTYRIGSGASEATSIIDGTTVVFGPSGVVVPGLTTLAPTAASITATATNSSRNSVSTATTAARSSNTAAQTSSSDNAAAARQAGVLSGGVGTVLITLFLNFLAVF